MKLDKLVDTYYDEFRTLGAAITTESNRIRIIRPSSSCDIGTAKNERTLQEQLELLRVGTQIEKILTSSPLVVESIDGQRWGKPKSLKLESWDETYVVNITFHDGRADGEVVKRQHPDDMPKTTFIGPIRSHESLYSIYRFDVPECDVVGEIESAIDAFEIKDALASTEETMVM